MTFVTVSLPLAVETNLQQDLSPSALLLCTCVDVSANGHSEAHVVLCSRRVAGFVSSLSPVLALAEQQHMEVPRSHPVIR